MKTGVRTATFVISLFVLTSALAGLVLFLFPTGIEDNAGPITLADLYSRTEMDFISSSEYRVDFLDYEPGDKVLIKDIITDIYVSTHVTTAFSFRSLGNHTFLTWPFFVGNLTDKITVGAPINITLEIINPESLGVGYLQGEWFRTEREGCVDNTSIEKANWRREEIPVDHDFHPLKIELDVDFRMQFEELTLVEYKISIDDEVVTRSGVYENQLMGPIPYQDIVCQCFGDRILTVEVFIDGKFHIKDSIETEIEPVVWNRFHFTVTDDNALLESRVT